MVAILNCRGMIRLEKRSLMRLLRSVALAYGFLFWLCITTASAAEPTSSWETEWRKTIEAAKKEGQLTVSHTRGPFDQVFADFSKRHPEIKIVSISGRGGDLISRIMAERRAEKYVTDIYLGSSGTPMDVLHPAKALEPIPTFMILPEVKDPSKWFRKQHHYADPDAKFIFVFEGVVRADMAFNTTLVDPKEFTSYWDLLKPKWKGKIAAMDPKLPGFFIRNNLEKWAPGLLASRKDITKEMVERYLARMYGDVDFVLTVTRDFVRNCQTPLLALPDDVPAHPYETCMEMVRLAPNSQVSLFPWKDSKENVALAVRHVRSFLRANRPEAAGRPSQTRAAATSHAG